MKTKLTVILTMSVAAVFTVAGCGDGGGKKPVTAKGNEMSMDAVQNDGDVKNKPPTVFAQPLARVNEAAARALISVGCKLKRQESYFASGFRPQKMGLLIGSGGETVKVFMLPQGDKVTNVWVDTDHSFVGMAGQQNWNKQVLAEMTSLLK
ncbi:MAG: hypothetical protein ABIP20_01720 [Chthoniobacteraceae bacterium]